MLLQSEVEEMIDSYEVESARRVSPNSITSSMEVSGANLLESRMRSVCVFKQLAGR